MGRYNTATRDAIMNLSRTLPCASELHYCITTKEGNNLGLRAT